MKELTIGVVGVRRGGEIVQHCRQTGQARLTVICDSCEESLLRERALLNDESILYTKSFDELLEQPLDAVVLTNYANEHAPLAIKAMERGMDVLCEVLPCQNPAEAVQLVETAERTGRKYCYLENYCYFPAVAEMRRLYREGKIGEFRYGEGEYIHNCETLWPDITYGQRSHWRNHLPANAYCTHSLGPLLYITGLRPVQVTGIELPFNAMQLRMGAQAGSAGMELVTLENGSVAKSMHGNLYRNSIWFSIYGDKGRMESAREDADCGDVSRLYVNADSYEGAYAPETVLSYRPVRERHWDSNGYGHSRADYYVLYHALEYLRGNRDAEAIDLYSALDMALPGMFAYFSVLQGGIPLALPNFRDKAAREQYRSDTRCTDPAVAGEQLLPSYSKGNPEIPEVVYTALKAKYEADRINHGVW